MDDQHESQYRGPPDQPQWNTIDRSVQVTYGLPGSNGLGLPGDQLQWSTPGKHSFSKHLLQVGNQLSQPKTFPKTQPKSTISRLQELREDLEGRDVEPVSNDLGLPGDRLQWSTPGGHSFGKHFLHVGNRLSQPKASTGTQPDRKIRRLQELRKGLAERDVEPVSNISSFMAAVADVNPPFKPRTLHRPWSISAGHGAHGAVEVHRYVPSRNFDVFNDSSSLKLLAYEPDPKRTGHYYAVKRLALLEPESKGKSTQSRRNSYALLADELRILAHPDLRGHPNIIYLFGLSHTPARGGIDSAEPNLVLQEGDCGDLYSFYRDVDMRFDRHTLVEVKLSLSFDIACGIEALHRHGVVHCDLKPQNILIRRRFGRDKPVQKCSSEIEAGQVALQSLKGGSPFVAMLADFGGSIITADHQTSDKVHLKVFTPLWCAPECYSTDPIAKDLLPRVDIYSAGLIFAFIFLEGRDIFTQVVERGMMHQHDTTLDRATVRFKKQSGAALSLALEQVRDFEASVFGLTATGQRLYLSRHQMYPPVVSDIFASILTLALQTDPSKRVADATDLLEPWHRVLQGDFHVKNSLHYSQPAAFRSFAAGSLGGKDYFRQGKTCARVGGHGCAEVPRLFANTEAGMSPGVFDVRKSFEVFRASLTSNLKTAIINDMMHELELLRSINRQLHLARLHGSYAVEGLVPLSKAQLQRGSDCAYQVSVACLEGFGRTRDDEEALRWMRNAIGSELSVAHADQLPLTVSLGIERIDKSDSIVEWAVKAIVNKKGHQGTVKALWETSEEKCTEAMTEYRGERLKETEEAFKRRTSEEWKDVFWHEKWKAKLTQMYKSSQGFLGMMRTTMDGGWSILHYAASLAHYGGFVGLVSRKRLDFLIDDLGADVRTLNGDSVSALDLAMARGEIALVQYLLDRHERCQPPFLPGSCPLQNVAGLPDHFIEETVKRVCRIAPGVATNGRSSHTGRTPLLNIFLTKEPLLPPARKAAILSLLAHGANPLLTATETGTASPLLLAVTGMEAELVQQMLLSVKRFRHHLLSLVKAGSRPQPANELARAFLCLVQIPRSVSLMTGVVDSARSVRTIIKIMLEHGVSDELPYVCRGIPHDLLSLACYYGRDDVMQAILAETNGAGPAVAKTLGPGQTGIQALGGAIECGFGEAVDLLLPRMAKLPQVTAQSLLLTGAVHHQPVLVPRLLGHFERAGRGAEVLEFQDKWGATILDLALEYGYFDLARHLLDKGAKYDVYRLKGDHNIDEGLQSTLASVLPRMEPIKFLMELTPKPRLVVTSTGLNVFHVLAADEKLIGTSVGRAEFLEALEYFHKLDPTLIHARGGARGLTPFHIVSLHYSETVGSFLHEHGADINTVSTAGHTPLDLLHFHDDGDRGVDEHLTVDYRTPGAPQTGIAICDFAMAGPAYWKLEARLSIRLKERYKTWGAKRGLQTMMRQLGLQNDPMASFWSGGITVYSEGPDGEERVSHFP